MPASGRLNEVLNDMDIGRYRIALVMPKEIRWKKSREIKGENFISIPENRDRVDSRHGVAFVILKNMSFVFQLMDGRLA